MAWRDGDDSEVGEKRGMQKKTLYLLLLFFLSIEFTINPFSTTCCAVTHKEGPRQQYIYKEKNQGKLQEPKLIQSTRPACNHAECVRHQVVYMLKKMVSIRYLFWAKPRGSKMGTQGQSAGFQSIYHLWNSLKLWCWGNILYCLIIFL